MLGRGRGVLGRGGEGERCVRERERCVREGWRCVREGWRGVREGWRGVREGWGSVIGRQWRGVHTCRLCRVYEPGVLDSSSTWAYVSMNSEKAPLLFSSSE